MKFPDRVKQTVTGSTAALVLGAAVAPYRTLAAAITAGDVAVGDRLAVCVEDAAGNWEESYYTVTSGTQLTRDSVHRSSGNAVTFPATAFCTVFGRNLVVIRDIAFSASVPLTHPGAAYMAQTTVAGPLTFTPAAGAVRGALAYLRLVADGTNAPNFSAFKEWGSSLGYDNRNGIVNQVQFFYDGTDHWYSVSQAVGAAPMTAPDTTAPTLSNPTSASTGPNSGNGSVTTDEGNGTLYYRATVNTTETIATVKAGSSQAVTSTGSKAVTVSGLNAGTTYYLHFVHTDAAGNDSARVTAASFTTAAAADTTAPTLSSPAATKTGSTTASGNVSTNEANGTLYRYASANAVESAATVKAANLTQAVSSTGVQNVSFTGLAAGATLYAHYLHRDAAGNDSTVSSSAAFTTDAAAPASDYPRIVSPSNMTESGTGPYTYTGVGAAATYDAGGILEKTLAAGVDGTLDFKVITPTDVLIGFKLDGTVSTWSSIRYGFYAAGVNGSVPANYRRITNGTNAAVSVATTPQVGDIIRIARVGNIWKIQCARSATPTTFFDMDTLDYGSSPKLWVRAGGAGTSAFELLAHGGFA